MTKFSYTIKDEMGIHARPAGSLAKIAKEFDAHIILESGEKRADVKKVMSVMGLGVRKGGQITITAEGPNEDEAIAKIEAFFKINL